jgi:spore coat protein CotH
MKRLILTVGLMTACAEAPEKAGWGLDIVDIRMTSADLSQLNASYNDKTTFPATITYRGDERRVRVNYAGRTTLDAWKKSWDLHLGDQVWRLAATPDDPTMLRSVTGYKLFAMAGFAVPDTEFVFVYLNDEPAGLFLKKELISEEFFARRGTTIRSLYKAHYNDKAMDERAITLLPEFFSAKYHRSAAGADKNWSDLRPLIHDMVYSAGTVGALDHASLYQYHAATIALANWDGFSNNYFLYNTVGRPEDFSFQPWDLDRAFEADATVHGIVGDDFWGAYIAKDPDRYEAYRSTLRSTIALLGSPELQSFVEEQATKIRAAWHADRALTGGDATFDDLLAELQGKIRARSEHLQAKLIRN